MISKPIACSVAWEKADWDEIKLVTYTLWSEVFIIFPIKGTLPKALELYLFFLFSLLSLKREGRTPPSPAPTITPANSFELVITTLIDL